MKTVSDYLKTITEDGEAAPTNTVGSGAIATREAPLGGLVKRKSLEDKIDEVKLNPSVIVPLVGGSTDKKFSDTKLDGLDKGNPLADAYAPGESITDQDSDDEKRAIFRAKQSQNSDSTMSFE